MGESSGGGLASAGGAAMGAMIGLALGGPFGAVVGASLTPTMERLVLKSLAEFRRRGDVLAQGASASSGMPVHEVIEHLVEGVDLQPLVLNVMDAAARTSNTQKLRALGRVLGEGIASSPGPVDEHLLIVTALRDLEEPHVRVIEVLEGQADAQDDKAGWTAQRVIDTVSGLSQVGAQAALSGLVRHGLAQTTSLWGGIGYELTGFGRAMVAVLRTV